MTAHSAATLDLARRYGFVPTLGTPSDDAWSGVLGQTPSVNVSGGTATIAGQTIDVNTLLTVTNLDPATVAAQAQAAGQGIVTQLGADALAKWNEATSTAANDARKIQAGQAALQLATNGFQPDDPQSQAALVTLVAGVVSFVPVVGNVLGGAVLLLYSIGEAIAGVLEKAGIIGPFGCFHKGADFTPQIVLGQYSLPAMPAGSFASLAVPALAQNASQFLNCDKNAVQPLQVLAALAAMWNQTSTGPPMSVYVPAIDASGAGLLFVVPAQVPQAFQPATSVTDVLGDIGAQVTAGGIGIFGTTFGLGQNASPPFILELTGSTLAAPAATPQATDGAGTPSGGGGQAPTATPPTPSTGGGGGAAVAAAAVVATGGAWLLLGQPLTIGAAKSALQHVGSAIADAVTRLVRR